MTQDKEVVERPELTKTTTEKVADEVEGTVSEVTTEPNQEAYPGIPNDTLDAIKSKYRVIFGSYFNDKPTLYRLMTTNDYLRYQDETLISSNEIQDVNNALPIEQRIPEQDIAEMISKKADELLVSSFTVYPEKIIDKVEAGEYPGGCIYSLTQSILVNSGFVELEPLLVTKEDVAKDENLIPTIERELMTTSDDLNATDLRNLINEHNEVLLVWFLNQLYIVRGFTYDEYSEVRRLSSSLDPAHLSIDLVSKYLIYPYELAVDDVPAGLVFKVLSDGILSISGFTNTNPDIVIME